MPVTGAVLTIAGLALIGVPGTSGFVSKWYLVAGAFEAGKGWLGLMIVASSFLAVSLCRADHGGRLVSSAWSDCRCRHRGLSRAARSACDSGRPDGPARHRGVLAGGDGEQCRAGASRGAAMTTLFSNELLLVLALAVPAAVALLVALVGRRPNLREAVSLPAPCCSPRSCSCCWRACSKGAALAHLVTIAPGLDLALALEPLGMLFACVAATLWIANTVYSIGYMRGNGEPRQTPFYCAFAVAIFSTMALRCPAISSRCSSSTNSCRSRPSRS